MTTPERPAHSASAFSMRDVAAAAQVSRMAVSRAFRTGASIRPELRARILEAAERLGYRPDPLVTKLMTSFAQRRPVNYRETLGVLWWPERWKRSVSPASFAAKLRAGLEASAVHHGCRIDHFIVGKTSTAALARVLAARHIQGVILTPPTTPDAAPPPLDWTRLSVMVVGSSLREPAFNRVHQDHYAAMVSVVNRLRKRGFTRPALVVNPGLEERMQRAYTAAFLAHDAGPPSHVLHLRSFETALLAKRLKALRPDVVIIDTEARLPAVRRALGKMADCEMVSMDVKKLDGETSGIFQNPHRMAECAIDLLMQARLRHETGVPAEPMVILTPGVWVEDGRIHPPASVES